MVKDNVLALIRSASSWGMTFKEARKRLPPMSGKELGAIFTELVHSRKLYGKLDKATGEITYFAITDR